MDRPADWIGVDVAVLQVLETVRPLPSVNVALEYALGFTLADDIISTVDHPPWDNSAMDGFATRAADIRGANGEAPVRLRVIESVPAGGFPRRSTGAGEAIRIMTGAPVPAGADGVVRLEHTRPAGEAAVEILDDADAGRNIRRRAEDVRAGEMLFRAGRRLRPAEIGVLASIGCERIAVHRRPRVAILATGDELVGLADFAEVRAGRRIVNSNTWALSAAVRETGGEVLDLGIARDDPADVEARLAGAVEADALVTTAGASVGDHDVVKDALERMGMDLRFWRVTMRPGSPFSFGTIPRPDGSLLPIFGLPGNPVSALVTFEVLVRPALRRMLGRADVFARTLRVRIVDEIRSTAKLTHFLRVTLETATGGLPAARLTGAQGSGILTSVARADALLIVPLGRDRMAAGEEADAMRLAPQDEGQNEPGFDAGHWQA